MWLFTDVALNRSALESGHNLQLKSFFFSKKLFLKAAGGQ
uniref:Uncharacterized protein n=1 Tax=Anguilla anguilla TaxID=7936 RepID=A0A0E9S7M1_ANGAN